ncbi:hypothetical protein QCA50_004793 [Cerrena zonata]|uniref:Peptidase A1 domain-containing protein n=1 Tax=Cerrena zonata TaxID=2478898 RepID=A0AAW0GHW0_9APHY
MSLLFSWLASVFVLAGLASAVTLPFTREEKPHSTSVRLAGAATNSDDPFNFQNLAGFRYLSTLHINGQPVQVELDTGSSDLWIDTKRANLTLEGGTPTNIPASIIYEDKTGASGNIELIDITWGDFTVKNQAFINAPGANGTKNILDGFLGLGPPSLSELSGAVQKANAKINGNMLITNIFDSYPDESNFITFLLSRNVAGIIDGGDFTIGEIVKGYEAITEAPKLPILSDSRWLTFIDGLNINGQQFTGNSHTVSGVNVPQGKVSAIFDTGISLDIAPKGFVDAMFQNVPGAVFDESTRNYIVPCNTKVNVSLSVGGLEYPIHPADLVTPNGIVNGSVICNGAFTASSEGTSIGDIQFGDAVMRNLYTLYNYGSFSRPGTNQPFIQILNLTNADKAWAEFDFIQPARVQQFLTYSNNLVNELSSTIVNVVTAQVPIPTSVQAPPDPTSTSEPKNFAAGALSSQDTSSDVDMKSVIRNTYIITGLVGATLLLLTIVTVVFLVKWMGLSKKPRYKPLIPPVDGRSVYSSYSGKYSEW